jgi:hypothetical protein
MKKTIKSIKKYFTIWWIPIAFYLLAIGIFFLGMLFERDWIIDVSLWVFLVNIIGTIISSIVQIVNRKWLYIIPQIGITAFLFYYASIILIYSPPDYYGANKKIPENIEIYEPVSEKPTKEQFDKYDLILGHSAQPGIYTYYTDYQPKENGYFYIKAFEITSNDRLSADRIKERSKIIVENLEKDEYQGEFTIYEGSWGDKYGSRIELWFQPSNGKDEYKITERNFIVEGWMR